ncbi:flavodoxin family protein [Amycolatopsis pittospori]|uniref:flavodoxin family protein n=1 Tax=Amycolatopsis pittospori TaxID=2749434 RepID=UPI0015F058F0|nr:flavodoxin family protein [Amycolatopsis pittospori]
MRTVVVFESMFGNTETLATAIGKGLAAHTDVDVLNVDEAPRDWDGIDLLVVGGPTHALGMTRPATRKSALEQAGHGVRSATGLREWIGSCGSAQARIPVAVFDTRMAKPRWLTGSAARGAQKALRRHGGVPLVPCESFFVDVSKETTALRDGEQERAESWGAGLGRLLAAKAGG